MYSPCKNRVSRGQQPDIVSYDDILFTNIILTMRPPVVVPFTAETRWKIGALDPVAENIFPPEIHHGFLQLMMDDRERTCHAAFSSYIF